ncbi:7319_t:CDS:1 [Cetraspora pellucida]|uniref:7319_t:CDS:1 n=1 Tax=Cetraspora pellucida TaxID=1433469 RepID=A0A9N9J801_9GLOM|nr:7319_t:CDS:1 [Cetraspora pellucida]
MFLRSDQEVEEIQHYFNEINERISQQENAIIIIGNPGEGKSTLLGYLTGIPLLSKEDEFGDYIIKSDNSNGILISDNTVSQTSLPICREVYWDCPGFEDTRGPVQNIVNAYSIYKLVKSVKRLKILLVISESTIKSTRKKEFLNLIDNLGETFKNIDELVQGLCLVITKSDKLDTRKVSNCFHRILEEYDNQESFSQSKRKILNFLSSSKSQIVFFNAPHKKDQNISDTDKILILEGIEKTSYLENLEPSILLDDKSKPYINDLVERFYGDINNYIEQKFYPAIQNYFGALIDTHIGTVKELRNSLIDFYNKFKNIYNNPEKFEENLHQIYLIVELMKRSDLNEELSKKISLLNFFKLVKPESLEIKGNTSSWYKLISELIKEIDILKSFPKVLNQGHLLTLEGMIIGTEDINIAMNDQKLSEINVFSLNSLFIDEDIIAPGINLTIISPQWRVVGKRIINLKGNPGPPHPSNKAKDGIGDKINDEIPKEKSNDERINDEKIIDEIPKEKSNDEQINDEKINDEIPNEKSNDEQINDEKINYEQINDEKINNQTNDEILTVDGQKINGEDGLPGLPGYNGGNFYGKGNTFFNISSLTIDVSGGDGGQGQDGGNGAKGFDGSDCGEVFVKNKNVSALISRKKVNLFSDEGEALDKVIRYTEKIVKLVLTVNNKHEEIYEFFDPGQKGGDGGRGGIGGIGGRPGFVVLNSSYKLLENPNILKESKQGLNGKGGRPGLGGKNGQKYRGVYINERVIPAIRGFMEFDSNRAISSGLLEATRAVTPAASSATITGAAVVGAAEASKKTLFERILIEIGLKSNQVKQVAFSVPGALRGLSITLSAQSAFSVISAYLSSHWKEAPHEVDHDELDERASEGNLPVGLNENNIKTPSDQLSFETREKEQLYKQFYDQNEDFIFIKELLYLEKAAY